MSRRALALALAVVAAGTAFVLPTRPARAVAADAPDTSAWVTNGNVHAVVSAGGRTYVGGSFDQVGPNTGFGVPLDAATGAAAVVSKVNGPVYAAVPDGAGGWYIGGDFTRVGPVSRHRAAHVRADGTVGSWNPDPDRPVWAIAHGGGSRIYLAGEFASVQRSSEDGGGRATAQGLAATKKAGSGGIDVTAPLPGIKPGVDASDVPFAVRALALSADASRLYVGGSFTELGGEARPGLGAVDLSGTPSLDPGWAPQLDGPVAALEAVGSRVFVGGAFTSVGGAPRAGLAALSATGAGELDTTWSIRTDGPVSAFARAGGEAALFVGGSFTRIGATQSDGVVGWSDIGGLAKLSLGGPGGAGEVVAAFDPAPDGPVLALGLSPDGSRLFAGGSFGGLNGSGPRFLAAVDAATGVVESAFDARVAATVRAVAGAPDKLFAGGDFTSVGGVIRRNLAALRADGTLDSGFSADTDGEVNALLVNGASLYVGGNFKNIGTTTGGKHRGLAKVDAATGAVDRGFVVKIDASVMSLARVGSHVYVGGNFSSVKDASGLDHARAGGARLNAATGAVDDHWRPETDAAIQTMAVSPDQSKVYIGGNFSVVAGKPRTRLAAVDPVTAAPTAWSPAPPAAIEKMDVDPDGSAVYLALRGRFGVGNRAQAWGTGSDNLIWDIEGDGDFQAVAATPSLVYIGGHFNYLDKAYERQHLAAVDPATGAIQPWGPSVGGVLGVLDLHVSDSYVYVAGEFDKIGNEAVEGIARFANLGDTPPVTTPPTSPPGGGSPGGGTGGDPDAGTDPGAGTAGTGGGRSGYWMIGADGAVYGFGDSAHFGNARPAPGSSAVDLEPTPSGRGYWTVTDRGVVTVHGDAAHFGAPAADGLARGEAVTSLSATPSGRGYWLFTNRGRVLPYGDAAFYGDMAKARLNGPVLDSIPTTSGRGYYMVASDGGIFAFGDAVFRGSMGGRKLNAAVQSLVPDGDGVGYWLVASDGGIFAFEAGFKGSMGGTRLNRPVTGMVRFADGYLMVAEDGGIFNFSTKPFLGSLGGNPPAHPIVSVAALG